MNVLKTIVSLLIFVVSLPFVPLFVVGIVSHRAARGFLLWIVPLEELEPLATPPKKKRKP